MEITMTPATGTHYDVVLTDGTRGHIKTSFNKGWWRAVAEFSPHRDGHLYRYRATGGGELQALRMLGAEMDLHGSEPVKRLAIRIDEKGLDLSTVDDSTEGDLSATNLDVILLPTRPVDDSTGRFATVNVAGAVIDIG